MFSSMVRSGLIEKDCFLFELASLRTAKPVWASEPEDVTTTLHREVALNCSAKGWPPVTSKWIRLHKDSKWLFFRTKTVFSGLVGAIVEALSWHYRCQRVKSY